MDVIIQKSKHKYRCHHNRWQSTPLKAQETYECHDAAHRDREIQKHLFSIIAIYNGPAEWHPEKRNYIGNNIKESEKGKFVLLCKIPRNSNHTHSLCNTRNGIGRKYKYKCGKIANGFSFRTVGESIPSWLQNRHTAPGIVHPCLSEIEPS